MHLVEPFAILHRKRGYAVLVRDIDRAECPAVHFQSLAVLFRCVTVSLIVGIRLNDCSPRELLIIQGSYPRTRNNVRTFPLSGVKLYRYLAFDTLGDSVINLFQAFR